LAVELLLRFNELSLQKPISTDYEELLVI